MGCRFMIFRGGRPHRGDHAGSPLRVRADFTIVLRERPRGIAPTGSRRFYYCFAGARIWRPSNDIIPTLTV